MTNHQPLTTEKYYQQKVRQEARELGCQENSKSIEAFMQFLFCIVVFLLTVTAVQQMPVWLPIVTDFVQQFRIMR